MKFKTTQPHPAAYVILILFAGLAFCLQAASRASAAPPPKPAGAFLTPASFSDVAETVSPAVVNIRTVKTIKGGGRVFRHFMPGPFEKEDPFQDFFNKFFGEEQQRDYKQRSLGSGFIIDKEGFIVTNNHVVENADKIKVKLKNGDEYDAEIVGRDANTDIALIKIKAKNSLPVLKIGDSDAIKVGQWVVAIGSPFGFEQTVTAGIVSAKGRVIGSGPYDDFIQTDASINPGNSGGPLINLAGEAVGINTAIIASGQGIGFAIPINMAKGIIEQLKTSGEVTRGWLGVAIQPISKELADYYGIKDGKGVLVTEVFSGDPADKAGIKPRDIILEVNNKKMEESRDLTRIIANTAVGETVTIKILRDGQEKLFRVEVAKREEAKLASRQPEQKHEDALGIRVTDLTAEVARRFNLKEPEGVIVVGVEAESKGDEAGVQVGDIIKEVNHQAVQTSADYGRAVAGVRPGETIQLFIRRMNTGFIVVKLVK
ncbi:MAG: DegQ family serine endoprotease [Thermodesulfobacteriota bacterium]